MNDVNAYFLVIHINFWAPRSCKVYRSNTRETISIQNIQKKEVSVIPSPTSIVTNRELVDASKWQASSHVFGLIFIEQLTEARLHAREI